MCLLLGVGVGVHGGGAEHDDGDRGGEQGGVLFPGGADRKVVRHCKEQECGVGEVPSLSSVLPKILILPKQGEDLHFLLGYQKHTGRSLTSCPSV